MPGKPRYRVSQVIAALRATKGMVYLTAKKLGCDPETVENYCKRHPSVQAAKEALRGEMVDMAEVKLWQSIQNGETWGIAFCLRTLGRHRGYVERQELTGKDGPLEHDLTVRLEDARERVLDRVAHLALRHAEDATNGH